MQPFVRWMLRRDIPEIMEIEWAICAQPWMAWDEEDFLLCLRTRECIGVVIEDHAEPSHLRPVLGYMVYEFQRARIGIMNLAVHPDLRRQGLGTAMIEKLKSKLSPHRRTTLAVNVRETNLTAQLFFQLQGFRAVGIRRGYYAENPDQIDDAIAMRFVTGQQPTITQEHAERNRLHRHMEGL